MFADLAFKDDLSPLLMFDYAEPKQFGSKLGQPRGVGQHPHRGFETVTIAFQGEVEHRDNKGNTGTIGPGDGKSYIIYISTIFSPAELTIRLS